MLLLVGLGNPGARYARTRHNIGFWLVDELARAQGTELHRKFGGEFALVQLFGQQIGLLKPQTFMNLSGTSVRPACEFYGLAASAVVIVHDELDLPLGSLRLKQDGGEAGHKGLLSVSQELGTRDYYRLRLGIGRPPHDFNGSTADFVLEAFAPDEGPLVESLIQRAVDAVQALSEQGAAAAMKEFNQKR